LGNRFDLASKLRPVIIHHYYGFQDSDDRIVYPDFAAGVLLSRGALKRIANEAASHDKNDFTIDAKFEFAKFVSETTGIVLKNVPKFCLLPTEVDCITHYEEPKYFPDEIGCGPGITNQNVYYAVKTFSGYHKTRVVYVKRTWAKQAKYVDFFSDTNETQIPSIDLGVENVKIGHCQKTISIMKYFLEQAELKHINWIVIADDDTLLNVEQLQRVINCLPTSNRAILGERYGFGFEWDGISG
jgi:UDP-glucose:O-linked fucose beta-1,3-glucosyltransferase